MPANKLSLHLVQFSTVPGRPLQTLRSVQRRLQGLRPRALDWLVFPEMWPSGFSMKGVEALAAETKACLDWLREFARRHRCYLSGSMLERQAGRNYNSAYLIDPSGKVATRYRKIHLFEYGNEHRSFCSGDRPALYSSPWGKIGLAICYDLRFPELFRLLSKRGAKMVVVPSAWPRERLDHFLTLLKARAIENQCYMVGVNKTGPGFHQKPVTYGGHSAIFGPWGNKLGTLGARSGILNVSLDFAELEKIRRRYPFLRSRVLG